MFKYVIIVFYLKGICIKLWLYLSFLQFYWKSTRGSQPEHYSTLIQHGHKIHKYTHSDNSDIHNRHTKALPALPAAGESPHFEFLSASTRCLTTKGG